MIRLLAAIIYQFNLLFGLYVKVPKMAPLYVNISVFRDIIGVAWSGNRMVVFPRGEVIYFFIIEAQSDCPQQLSTANVIIKIIMIIIFKLCNHHGSRNIYPIFYDVLSISTHISPCMGT